MRPTYLAHRTEVVIESLVRPAELGTFICKGAHSSTRTLKLNGHVRNFLRLSNTVSLCWARLDGACIFDALVIIGINLLTEIK